MTDDANAQKAGEPAFQRIEVKEEPVQAIAPEAARAGYRVFRGADGFEVAIPEHVIERAVAVGRRAAPNEWYGLVAGRLCEHEGRRHVVVLGFAPDPDARVGPHSVETTPASELRTRLSLRALFPDGISIGWAHGHVRHGVTFSSTDMRTQATWRQPHALGIVVDPWHPDQLAVYRGPDAELLTLAPPPAPPPMRAGRLRPAIRRAVAVARKGAARARAKMPVIVALMAAAMGLGAAMGCMAVSRRLAAVEFRLAAGREPARGSAPPPSPTGWRPDADGMSCRE